MPSVFAPGSSQDKGKGILGTPPLGLPLKEHLVVSLVLDLGHSSSRSQTSSSDSVENGYQLTCPRFDGIDFRGWWFKLEQFFKADEVEDRVKVRTMMLNLDERALDWHHFFFCQRHGGIRQLTWDAYLRALKERFGSSKRLDPMIELVALKQTSTIP